jgi:hypothetical protein
MDEARSIARKAGFVTDRFELADYKKVDSLFLPIAITLSTEGRLTWMAKDVDVNPQFGSNFFELD